MSQSTHLAQVITMTDNTPPSTPGPDGEAPRAGPALLRLLPPAAMYHPTGIALALRLAKGWTQAEVAENSKDNKVGVRFSLSTWKGIEGQTKAFRVDILRGAAETFDLVDLDAFIGEPQAARCCCQAPANKAAAAEHARFQVEQARLLVEQDEMSEAVRQFLAVHATAVQHADPEMRASVERQLLSVLVP